MIVIDQDVELVHMTPYAPRVIEAAGRTAYRSEDRITDESADSFVRMIIARGHESVLEHASATYRITCDRGISHELVRHRLTSPTQESTRFCNYSKGKFDGQIRAVCPVEIDLGGNEEARQVWKSVMVACESGYLELLRMGFKPGCARGVLPTNLATTVVLTANLREWRHIIRTRTAPAAHIMMRDVMFRVFDDLRMRAPSVFDDLADEVEANAEAHIAEVEAARAGEGA